MKAKFIAIAFVVALLFGGANSTAFAQDKNVKQQVKSKTETTKHEVKAKTEEGMKNQPPVDTKKIEQTKEKIKIHKTHKPKVNKNKPTETKTEKK
jgi:hypothetical protein